RQRGSTSSRDLKSAKVLELHQVNEHFSICDQTFDPGTYHDNGYALRSTIRTDRFRLQLLAFKLKELNCVKYKRLRDELLLPKLTCTLGGVDYYLIDVRNVIKTKEVVERLWNCSPDKIKVLGLDLGQRCVVGAYIDVPTESGDQDQEPIVFRNLAVKQRALYQPPRPLDTIFPSAEWRVTFPRSMTKRPQ
ncbi:hypothetical protein BGZ65_010916, partial [Modicella reniformis]